MKSRYNKIVLEKKKNWANIARKIQEPNTNKDNYKTISKAMIPIGIYSHIFRFIASRTYLKVINKKGL